MRPAAKFWEWPKGSRESSRMEAKSSALAQIGVNGSEWAAGGCCCGASYPELPTPMPWIRRSFRRAGLWRAS